MVVLGVRRYFKAALSGFLLFSFALIEASYAHRPPTGRFLGCLFSNGEWLPVETNLVIQSQALGGTYIFLEDGVFVNGELEHLAVGRDFYSMIWKDKYGTGKLVIRFTPDTNRFDGDWSAAGQTEQYIWNGKRSENPLDKRACDQIIG